MVLAAADLEKQQTQLEIQAGPILAAVLGVVGLGKIGSHVARVARAMGMEVAAYDPFISPERAQQMQVRLLPLPQLFAEADYISLHLPRTPDTENLVNAELLRTMKPTARLVNCARGGIVDEAALAEAVEAGVIAGAVGLGIGLRPEPEQRLRVRIDPSDLTMP